MKKIIGLFVIALLFVNCDTNKKFEGFRGYDKQVLENWADNMIIPSYKNYQEKATLLTETAKSFEESPTEANFSALKNAWLESYKAYQKTIIFNFRDGYNVVVVKNNYLAVSNTYPTNGKSIEKNIDKVEKGKEVDFDIQYTYQGFPALDYLLFSEGKDLSYYQQNKAARAYVRMLANILELQIDKVVAYWNKNRDKYVNDTNLSGTGAYSSTINAFIEMYELQIRSKKVGNACGATPGQKDIPIPNHIEAYYNGDISKELLKIALQSSQDFFNGKTFDGNNTVKSLSAILKEIGSGDLVNRINGQYDSIYQQIESATATLKELAERGKYQTDTKQRPLYDLYLAIQRNVANYKRRMFNALNVTVTYKDGDGVD